LWQASEAQFVETGTEICYGEYGGVSGFKHIMRKMKVSLEDAVEANNIGTC
jgi:citrate (Re)-synthase